MNNCIIAVYDMVSDDTKKIIKESFLGSSQTPNHITDEDPTKVTMLLPTDTIELIDSMVKTARVGSRGRLIQMLIDDVSSLRKEYDALVAVMEEWQENQDTHTFTIQMIMYISTMLQRLARYYGPPNTERYKGK